MPFGERAGSAALVTLGQAPFDLIVDWEFARRGRGAELCR
jgi:hypothetical protein